MHKKSRLISVVCSSGRRLYGGSAAARLKTDNDDSPLTLSVPSAKSWARPPQTAPPAVTRFQAPSLGSQSRQELGQWTIKSEVPRSVSILKGTVNASSSSRVENNLSSSRANPGAKDPRQRSPPAPVDRHRDLADRKDGSWGLAMKKTSLTSSGQPTKSKWALPPHMEPSNTRNPSSRPSLDTRKQDDRLRSSSEYRKDSSLNQTSNTRNRLSRSSFDSRRDERMRSSSEYRKDSSLNQTSNTRNRLSRPSLDSRQDERMRSSSEYRKDSSLNQPPNTRSPLSRPSLDSRQKADHRRKDSSLNSAPAATSQTSTNDTSPLPDYSSFRVFRDHDDPRRAHGRKRAAPERNTYHEYNRRETVLNKPLIRKTVKPKLKQIVRRKDVFIPTTVTVAMLARLLKVKLAHLLSKMRRVGMDVEANYDHILSADYAALLAEEFGFNPAIDDDAAFDIYPPKPHPTPSTLPSRPPIVTIMGHVDHGKTTLLDTLRSASVAKGEAGGITQHIGAFSVPVTSPSTTSTGPRSITFLDTPGHAAFSAMRARGAHITDIIVLVVAADDGIMPQTEEVIKLLKREDNPVDLVVAINKIDKHDANPDAVKKALMAYGVQLEDFGGDVPAVHVSGLTGEGLPDLTETLSAVAEVRDLRADQDGPVYGHIIESNIHKGLGSVATVLIRQGCLRIGSHIISGTAQGKVRRMTDSSARTVQSALPGMAVTVSGWKTLPKAGDEVLDGAEGDIKKAIVNRLRREETEALQEDAEAINESRRQERQARAEGEDAPVVPVANDGPKELKLLIKGDVSGSCEALEGALNNIGNDIAISKVIQTGVGDITESDILMAKAANGTIIGFSVSAPRSILSLATQNGVPVFTGNIIYRLIDDVRSRVIDMLPKTIETKVTGEATVLQIFDITGKSKQIIKVAGCRVVNGLVDKQKFARVIRTGHVVHEGSLDTMRQLKKEITEARKGTECGLTLKEFSDMQEGDLIQMYERIEKPGVI